MAKVQAEFRDPVDSKALFDELKAYDINVTDLIDIVVVHGDIQDYYLELVIRTLEKYGVSSITIKKSPY